MTISAKPCRPITSSIAARGSASPTSVLVTSTPVPASRRRSCSAERAASAIPARGSPAQSSPYSVAGTSSVTAGRAACARLASISIRAPGSAARSATTRICSELFILRSVLRSPPSASRWSESLLARVEERGEALVVLAAGGAPVQVRAHAGNGQLGVAPGQLELDVAVEVLEALLAAELVAGGPEQAVDDPVVVLG